jgi:hypothetical protein
MIARKTTMPAELPRQMPERSPAQLAAFPIAVNFLDGESFTVELTTGTGPDPDRLEEGSWPFDPSWAGRQFWPGLEADE